jgi:hypothetical protein
MAVGLLNVLLSSPHNSLLPGIDGRLGTVFEVEFPKKIADVRFHSAFTDHKRF